MKPVQNQRLVFAQELYRVLISPIAGDLQQAQAHTLMISLDGVLRYLPLAALHDGERYLAERYALAIFTPAGEANLNRQPQSDWNVAGLGVSKAIGGFPALEAVPDELDGIVLDDTQDQNGVLPGLVHLNENFTANALKNVLQKRYPVVHIATHFDFQPGTEERSALLLGDGNRLTLKDIRNQVGFNFSYVDPLTLSACNTAIDENANGVEIEGLGTLAQRRGAQGVLATLWAVADKSTAILMQALYQLRGSQDILTKAEALRQAQLMLLHGEHFDAADVSYAHPYYWAPFILMGNWL